MQLTLLSVVKSLAVTGVSEVQDIRVVCCEIPNLDLCYFAKKLQQTQKFFYQVSPRVLRLSLLQYINFSLCWRH